MTYDNLIHETYSILIYWNNFDITLYVDILMASFVFLKQNKYEIIQFYQLVISVVKQIQRRNPM